MSKTKIHTESGEISENGHATPERINIAGMSAQEKRALLEAHKAEKSQEVEKSAITLAQTYDVTRGFRSIDKIVKVPCPLAGYEHLTVLYKTNAPAYKRSELMPSFEEPEEVSKAREAMQRPEGWSDSAKPEELTAWSKAIREFEIASAKWQYQVGGQWCEWIAVFVQGLEGWVYERQVGETPEGEPIYEPIPKPSAWRPETFQVVRDYLPEVAAWLGFEGYSTALLAGLGEGFTKPS